MKEDKLYWISTLEDIPTKKREVLNKYLLGLKLIGRAEATIIKYRRVLEKFLSKYQVPLEKLTSKDVFQWLNEDSVNKGPRTMETIYYALLSFFNFCSEEGYMKKLVLKRQWKPRIPLTMPKYLSQAEYTIVTQVAKNLPIRDHALILFMFSTGCSVSEVTNFNRENIDTIRQTAVIQGKGKRERFVYLTKECRSVLHDYLQTRSDNHESLFLNKFGERLGTKGIYNITRKLGEKAGLIQNLHPNIIRHTFAFNMAYRKDENYFISDVTGFHNLNTTLKYADMTSRDLNMVYEI